MSALEEIVRKKRERLLSSKSAVPLREIKARAEGSELPLNFSASIKRKANIKFIPEIKKASPSKGLIRADFDPEKIAFIYKDRADAISVLTEEDFFQGSLTYLEKVKKISGRPILRKDFIFDHYQIYESRAEGADAILLIAKLLEKSQARDYLELARELGLSVLFEVHDLKDLELALEIDAPVIGINNRDLNTLEIDLRQTLRLKKEIPPDKIIVSESGIRNRADVEMISNAGVDAILVGTSIMREKDIDKKLEELLGYGNGKS